MRTAIIGSGFGWLAAAIVLAKKWQQVTVYEKNEQLGGRASVWEQNGFRRDMGPSWYLMPDAFKTFFAEVGENVEDYLQLKKLSPSYKVFFHGGKTIVDVHDDLEKNRDIFEKLEPGSTDILADYIKKAQYQYDIAMKDFVPKNYDSVFDFFTRRTMTEGYKLHVFENMQKYAERYFKTVEMQKIVQYPLVFLGTAPQDAPALYNIMTYVDFGMGVWYPQWGINEVIQALVRIAKKHGVVFHTNSEIQKIIVEKWKTRAIQLASGEEIAYDVVVSNADMQWSETQLLDEKYQTYPSSYWEKKVMAPSGFILYLGVKGKIKNLNHHTLIFADDWKKNFAEIFGSFTPPSDPSLYICCPSKTDPSVAPEGDENLFVLVPFPPGVQLTDAEVKKYRNKIIALIEQNIWEKFADRIVVERIFWNKDFSERYHAYKGTALGLAHTLKQTAIFRPNNVSKKVKWLYYVGWYTNPGIGMPMCLISGLLLGKRFK
jgi:phytoene desaturase